MLIVVTTKMMKMIKMKRLRQMNLTMSTQDDTETGIGITKIEEADIIMGINALGMIEMGIYIELGHSHGMVQLITC